MSFAYDEGEVTMTDAVGDIKLLLVNQQGYIAKAIDPSGNVTTASLNGDDEATSYVAPGQFAYTATYDALGNVTTETNPQGGTSAHSTMQIRHCWPLPTSAATP